MAAVVTRRIVVSGRVQGVGYRAGCAATAKRVGVGGHVRNLDDGRVEVVATGPAAAVEQLVEWCGSGPPGARVASVEVDDEPPPSATVVQQRFEVR